MRSNHHQERMRPVCRRALPWVFFCLVLGLLLPGRVFAAPRKNPIPQLLEALQHKDRRVRLRALRCLGNIGSPAKAAAKQVIEALDDKDMLVRVQAMRVLAQLGPALLPSLEEALKSAKKNLKVGACEALALMGAEAAPAVEALISTTGQGEAIVRAEAMRALGEIGPAAKKATPLLRQAIVKEEGLIRLVAALALEKIQAKKQPVAAPRINLIQLLLAPPLRLTPAQEAVFDSIVLLQIEADGGLTGRNRPLPAALGQFAVQTQYCLPQEAIPALVRGLNLALAANASCPMSIMSGQLYALIPQCTDPEMLDYVLRTIRPDNRTIVDVSRTVRGLCLQRKAELVILPLLAQRQAALEELVTALSKLDTDALRPKLVAASADVRWATALVAGAKHLPLKAELIERIGDPHGDVRQAARLALVRLSRGTDFGPQPSDGPGEISRALRRWRTWWAQQDDNPKPPKRVTIRALDPLPWLPARSFKPPAAAKNDAHAREVTRLAKGLVEATPAAFSDALAKLEGGKGVSYSEALAQALRQLDSEQKQEARNALARRTARLKVTSLRPRLRDPDAELRRAAALACALKNKKELIPDLIPLLHDRDAAVAQMALASLRVLSGQDFGPEEGVSVKERAEAVRRWQQWWQQHKDDKETPPPPPKKEPAHRPNIDPTSTQARVLTGGRRRGKM